MYIRIMALLAFAIGPLSIQAQNSALDQLLQSIESNNQSLIAYRSYMEVENLQYRQENKLPDPQASAYYLPFGEHNSGDYSEFEISQAMEFPTVYSARAKWINAQQELLHLNYQKLKQEMLLRAKLLALELIYIQKQDILIQERLRRSKKLYEQVQILYNKGQSGILDLNKAKIVWLDQQFAAEEHSIRQIGIQQELQTLNGGKEISFAVIHYPDSLELPSPEIIWSERIKEDAQFALLEQQKQLAQQQLKVERNSLLPDLTAGFNYQGVESSNYSGFYGGISIPLWSGRNKVKMAEARINYQEQYQSEILIDLHGQFSSQIRRYQLLLGKYREYQQAISGLNSEMLLYKSYELGEISFMEYHREVSFYREAENRVLIMEKELQQLKAELLKHQL